MSIRAWWAQDCLRPAIGDENPCVAQAMRRGSIVYKDREGHSSRSVMSFSDFESGKVDKERIYKLSSDDDAFSYRYSHIDAPHCYINNIIS
eukprot:1195879-Prorocentrum_minimum.AAC.5